MPTVDSLADTGPWFFDHRDPLMAASSNLGPVTGFDRVPNDGPQNAQLNGTLIPDHTGHGHFLVDLDSERVICPFEAVPGPDPEIDKHATHHVVPAGGLAQYHISVGNRGHRTAQNWWACDRMPAKMRFASATRKLRRLGHLECLVIPTLKPHERVSFDLTLHVAHDAHGKETNIEEVIPGPPPNETIPGPPPAGGGPTDPPGGGPPTVPPADGKPAGPPAEGKPPHFPPIREDEATVIVRPAAPTPPRHRHPAPTPPPPRVTG